MYAIKMVNDTKILFSNLVADLSNAVPGSVKLMNWTYQREGLLAADCTDAC
jgi:hypothetical protein